VTAVLIWIKGLPTTVKPTLMNFVLTLFHWRRCFWLSIFTLGALIVLNFYGLYTDRFYLLKPDNYIFPLLTFVHFTFLYVVDLKIREKDYTDAPMRNLEYALYVISLVYIFKLVDTFYILMSYKNYADFVIPASFLPMGTSILALQLLLLFLTLLSFAHRKSRIGAYNFDTLNDTIDPWP